MAQSGAFEKPEFAPAKKTGRPRIQSEARSARLFPLGRSLVYVSGLVSEE